MTGEAQRRRMLQEHLEEEVRRRHWALVTGSTRGLGLQLAIWLARHSYNVILHGRSVEQLNAAASKVQEQVPVTECTSHQHGLTMTVCGDLAEERTIEQLVENAQEKSVHVLVNNAGMYLNQTVESVRGPDIAQLLAVNLLAPILLSRALLPVLRENKGQIVNINSQAAHSPSKGEAIYAASKAGLAGFSKAWKLETMPVRVIDVFLGAMNTGMAAGRSRPDLLMQPEAAAQAIVQALECSPHESSIRFDSLDLKRGWYS